MVVEETVKVKSETRYLSMLLGAASFSILLFGIYNFVSLSKVAAFATAIEAPDYAAYTASLAWGSLAVSVILVVMLVLFMRYINKRMRIRSQWFASQIDQLKQKQMESQ